MKLVVVPSTVVVFVLLVSVLASTALAQSPGPLFNAAVTGTGGAVATDDDLATQAGLDALREGGNAMDAIVTAAFTMAVTRPFQCSIGAGGYLVVHTPDGESGALDLREKAPAAVTGSMDEHVKRVTHFNGHAAVLVPGMVAGMDAALERFGTIDLARAIEPAAAHATDGFLVGPGLSKDLILLAPFLQQYRAAAEAYLIGGVAPYPPGSMLVQSDYGHHLMRLAEIGPSHLYEGELADLIVDALAAEQDGLVTKEDLADYSVAWREPVTTTYRGHEIIGMPPSTSGGTFLVETLNILEGYDLPNMTWGSADHLHVLHEAMSIAWADRSRYLGDPDFNEIPLEVLTNKSYAEERRAGIDLDRVGSHAAYGESSSALFVLDPTPETHTTHLSAVDADGMLVAFTCSNGNVPGNAFVAKDAGFPMNNHWTDFSGPSHPANGVEPHKRPRSSQSPTIVLKDSEPWLSIGGAGGQFIYQGVLQTLINRIDFGMPIDEAMDAPRLLKVEDSAPFKHSVGGQTRAEVHVEQPGYSPETLAALAQKGYDVTTVGRYFIQGFLNAVELNHETGERLSVSDPRWESGMGAINMDEVPVKEPDDGVDDTGEENNKRVPAPSIVITLILVLTLSAWRSRHGGRQNESGGS